MLEVVSELMPNEWIWQFWWGARGEGINFVSTQAAGMLLCVNTWIHGGRGKSLSGREASDPLKPCIGTVNIYIGMGSFRWKRFDINIYHTKVQTYGTSLFTCSKPAGWHSGWNHLVTHWTLSRYSFQNLQMSQLEDLRLPLNYIDISIEGCADIHFSNNIIIRTMHTYRCFSLLFVYPELFEVRSSTGVSLLDIEHCLVQGRTHQGCHNQASCIDCSSKRTDRWQ